MTSTSAGKSPAPPCTGRAQTSSSVKSGATSPEGLAVELAVRDWSRRDGDVAGRLRRADNRRMGFVRSLFGEFCADEDDVEVRSMMSYSMVIGSYFVAVEHGDKTRSQVLQLAIDHLLR